jgi:GcrA cell cycle regulator
MDKRYGFNWDDAAIERLRVLWFAGYSSRQIGRIFGVTRNSIIGKTHRLGWTGMERVQRLEASKAYRLPPKAVRPPPEPKKPPAKKKLRKPLEVRLHRRKVERPKPDPPIGAFTLMDLRYGVCKWPEGDRSPYSYCGAKALETSSYCADHHRRAHQGPQHRALRPIESYAIRYSRQAA